MPYLQKLPKFGKINYGTAAVKANEMPFVLERKN